VNRRALLIGGAALALAPRATIARAAGPLDYLVELEALQVAVYDLATQLPLTGQPAALAGRYRNHENEHLQRVSQALHVQPPAVAPPKFTDESGFLAFAQRVEGLAVSAYNGAIPTIGDHGLRAELAAIVQTEARHSAAIRALRATSPSPRGFEPGAAAAPVQRALAALQG